MIIRLLFITSHFFYPLTLAALERLAPDCQTKVVPYDDFSALPEIYRTHQAGCDAVFVSGISAQRYIELHCPNITKPLTAFQVDSDGLHRDVLRFAVENQSLDFSRVAMDFLLPLGGGYSVADFLEIDDIQTVFEENQRWMQDEQVLLHGAEALILGWITQLWEQKAIDCVICMYSGNIPKLRELGIPYRCPFLSDGHLKRLIRDTLVKLELKHLHDNHPAIIQIFHAKAAALEPAQSLALEALVRAFFRSNLIECVIQPSESCCSVITSMQVVRFLTEEFQSCRLSSQLETKLDFPLSVGYGIGATISQAMNNVQVASREARILGHPFAVDSNGNLIGPLRTAANVVIPQSSLLKLSDIAHQASLSSMTIQKILAILHNRGTDKITTQELATGLDTTVRNANRIMKNLIQAEFATPVYSQTTHSRGRPVQVYSLNFPISE